jgi:hypothetical protein
MRYLRSLAILFFSMAASAQAPIKTVPGDFTRDIFDLGAGFRNPILVSSAGDKVALSNPGNYFTIIDVNTGATVRPQHQMTHISPDHRYLYANARVSFEGDKGEPPPITSMVSVGVASETTLRPIACSCFVYGMDEQNNFITSGAEYDIKGRIKVIRGLYRVDRLTGKQLEILRPDTDTLFVCKNNNCHSSPFFTVGQNFLLLNERDISEPIQILPFGKANRVSINETGFRIAYTDGSFIYVVRDLRPGNSIKVYDAFSGKLLGTKSYQYQNRGDLSFSFSRNYIYYFNQVEGKVYEDKVARDTITTTRSWDVGTTLDLSKDQEWLFAVSAGPSLFFIPRSMDKAEAGGKAANTATFFNAASGRISLRIYPFFNQPPNQAAIQEKVRKEQREYLDKLAKEKPSVDPCETRWNIPGLTRGLTVKWRSLHGILMSYDCAKDLYKIWLPAQVFEELDFLTSDESFTVEGEEFRRLIKFTDRQYVTCTDCGGDGSTKKTRYAAKANELPWAYLEDAVTGSLPGSLTNSSYDCKTCRGSAVVLK